MVAWFDIEFGNLNNIIRFSTGPSAKYTHWKSTVFYLDGDYKVAAGDRLEGNIFCTKSKKNFRELDIKISYKLKNVEEKKVRYQLKQYTLR